MASLSSLARAADVEAFLAAFYAPSVPWRLLGGVLHICALAEEPGAPGVLRNIVIGDAAPKSDHDWFALNMGRALAHGIVQSGANMRAEGGFAVETMDPFAAAVNDWRAAHRARWARQDVVALLTTGRGLNPGWAFFKQPASGGGGGGLVFAPVVATPAACADGIRQAFASAGAPAPRILTAPGELYDTDAGTVAVALAASIAASGRVVDDATAGSAAADAAARPLVCIECGPTSTRPLYTRKPAGVAAAVATATTDAAAATGAGAVPATPTATDDAVDDEVWVATGAAVAPAECPVEWWMLSTFRGPLAPAARGAPLVRRAVVDAIFHVCAEGSAPTADGVWTFQLLHNRAKPLPAGWPAAAGAAAAAGDTGR
jgi:hypothetical protein